MSPRTSHADAGDLGPGDVDALVDVVLRASQALVAVAARSLADAQGDVTLPQFRALVLLAARGPLTSGAFAETLGVHPSTATRMCDRLLAKGLIARGTAGDDRRGIAVELSKRGRRLVDSVTEKRRKEIASIIRLMSQTQRDAMIRSLRAFGDAAGERGDHDGAALGWTDE